MVLKKSLGRPTTLLLGSYGRGNSGDDVFLHAAAELFAGHKLYINSADDTLLPADIRDQVETISTTRASDIFRKIRVMLSLDQIVYWGGDVWVKLYGDRFPRQSLYKMIVLNLLARVLGKKVFYVGCGIGDLHGYSLFLARMSARLANTITTREARSAKVLGLPRVRVLPDLAVNLPYYQPTLHRLPHTDELFKIVISLLYYVPEPERRFPQLVDELADFLVGLDQRKFRIVLLPMLVTAHDPHNDIWASQCLQDKLSARGIQSELHVPANLQDVIEALGSAHLVIGGRLHANILAVFNGTPCIGLAYRPKVASFFADNDAQQFCLNLDELSRLPSLFALIHEQYDSVTQQFYDISQTNLARAELYRQLIDATGEKSYQDVAAQYE